MRYIAIVRTTVRRKTVRGVVLRFDDDITVKYVCQWVILFVLDYTYTQNGNMVRQKGWLTVMDDLTKVMSYIKHFYFSSINQNIIFWSFNTQQTRIRVISILSNNVS